MKDFLIKIFTSKPAKIVYAFVLIFALAAAFFAGVFIPINSGYWFWAIPIGAAVIVAAPTYIKAIKWCVETK